MEDTLLIQAENESPKMVIILDDHKAHLKSHIRYFYRKGMIKHIIQHVYLWYRQKKSGIPSISLSDILKRLNNR